VDLKRRSTMATMTRPINTCLLDGMFRCGDEEPVPFRLLLNRGRSVFFRRRNPSRILQCSLAYCMGSRSTPSCRATRCSGNWLLQSRLCKARRTKAQIDRPISPIFRAPVIPHLEWPTASPFTILSIAQGYV
jgi:hypothetical protein